MLSSVSFVYMGHIVLGDIVYDVVDVGFFSLSLAFDFM